MTRYAAADVDARFYSAAAALRGWAAAHDGNTYPPKGAVILPDGRDIRDWASNLRYRVNSGQPTPAAHRATVESIPGWTWRTRAVRADTGSTRGDPRWSFDTRLADLARRHAAGDPPPYPAASVGKGERLAAHFAYRLRAAHLAGTLPPAQAAAVEAAIPGWSWAANGQAKAGRRRWQATYDRVLAAAKAGTVRGRDREWLTGQRRAWARLDPGQRSALEQVPGWGRTPRVVKTWDEQVAAAAEFIAAHGRRPPATAGNPHARLGRWLKDALIAYRAGRLTPGRVADVDRLIAAAEAVQGQAAAAAREARRRGMRARAERVRAARDRAAQEWAEAAGSALDDLRAAARPPETPPYQRIADDIACGIRRGDLRPGDRLPPGPVLAAAAGCATTAPVTRACRILADAGMIARVPGGGYVVADRPPAGGL